MSLLAHLVASAVGSSKTKKMKRRMFEILEKYKENIDASSEKNIELENWLKEQKNK